MATKDKFDKKKDKFKKEYGFPVEDLWAINHWLSGALSKRLLVWVKSGVMSYPVGMTPEEWEGQVRTAGEALKKYHDEDGTMDKDINENAVAAMQWVTDNWHDLWD